MKYTKIFIVTLLLASQAICSSKDVSQGCNNFSYNMYQQLKNESGNLFFSPYSITTALSATYAGARGITETEISNVLCNSLSQEEFHPSYASTIEKLNQNNSKYQLEVANKVFVQDDYRILDSFEHTIKSNYGAAFDILDFKNPFEASAVINSWVYEKTHEKIKDIVSPDLFDDNTRMVIANAIYFKGKWVKQFEKSSTKPKPFHVDRNGKIEVDMMQQENHFNYMENDEFKMLELPYEGDRLSMFVILPKKIDGLKNIEENISNQMLNRCFSQLRNAEVNVSLPKFKLEVSYNLNHALKQMGMPSAFDSSSANFSGISGTNDLFISDVLHKAFVETNEEGTEAAAATVLVFSRESSIKEHETFNADRPFIFFIKDKLTDLILFMGRISNPKA